jgi:hypothetical protein
MSDMAKEGKFHTEHLLELQLPRLLLRTAYTGELPKLDKHAATQLIKAAKITEENLFRGWHKLYPSNINLSPIYEVVNWKDLPNNYVPPLNNPAGRVMTALGDWANMQNLAVTIGDINLMKGRLFRLHDPMADDTFANLLWEALKNDEKANKLIAETFQNVGFFQGRSTACSYVLTSFHVRRSSRCLRT